MIAAFELQSVAQYMALRVAESIVEGMVIFAFAASVCRLVPKPNAKTKFAVWFSSLLAIALAPVATGIWSSQASGYGNVRPAILVPGSWALYLFAGWGILAGWFLLGVARALWRLHVLKKDCQPIDTTSLDPSLLTLLEAKSGTRAASLCFSAHVKVPTAVGLTKPRILVPAWVMEELSSEELKHVLIHEMAHLRRRDDWSNLVQQVIKALFFFHPAVWWIEKEISLEREIACDDAVLETTKDPHGYAACLARLAERSFVRRSFALAQAVLGKIRQTSVRVARILEGNPSSAKASWKPAASLVAGFAVMFSIGTARFQRLIGFENHVPQQLVSAANASGGPAGHTDPSWFHNANLNRTPTVRPVQAKFETGSANSRRSTRVRPRVSNSPLKSHDSLVHLASSKKVAVPVEQAVLVVIQETAQDTDAAPGIETWHVTVLRYVVRPASIATPGKQI